MKKTLIIMAVALLAISCEKKSDSPALAGETYTGIKKVHYSSTNITTTDTVKLEFESGRYSYTGSSDLDYGRGGFTISDEIIQFNDELARNAMYSWDWILSGQFDYSMVGDSLILTRSFYGQEIECRLGKIGED